MSEIHETAIIGDKVKIGKDVKILPYCVIDGDVEIGDGTVIGPQARITGWVRIGKETTVFPFTAIGEPPQDYSYDGTPGLINIGEKCILREGVTIHTPVGGDDGCTTEVGNNVFLMGNSHVAHNAVVKDNVVVANGTLLAGYVVVEEGVFLSANIGVHQFCRIGAYAMVGAVVKVAQDLPPFMLADGKPCEVRGLNVVGLRRGGFKQAERSAIKQAYKILYSGKPVKDACADIEEQLGDDPNAMRIVEFVRNSKRGIMSHYGKK